MNERYQNHIKQLHDAVASNLTDLSTLSQDDLKKIIAHYEKILALVLSVEEPDINE
jgi:hypothetical protein